MRLWTLHPEYLDTKGLVALWRESLLAKKVLENRTKGYKNHPQLFRFRAAVNSLEAINFYLNQIWIEANLRNYKFDKSKIEEFDTPQQISVTEGQVAYEFEHLKKKLKFRDVNFYDKLVIIEKPKLNPLFYTIKGDIEQWEKI